MLLLVGLTTSERIIRGPSGLYLIWVRDRLTKPIDSANSRTYNIRQTRTKKTWYTSFAIMLNRENIYMYFFIIRHTVVQCDCVFYDSLSALEAKTHTTYRKKIYVCLRAVCNEFWFISAHQVTNWGVSGRMFFSLNVCYFYLYCIYCKCACVPKIRPRYVCFVPLPLQWSTWFADAQKKTPAGK